MADTPDKEPSDVDGAGLDMHGPELVAHQVTTYDDDGNADVELNFSFPLTATRHEQLMHLIEEGYSKHDAYVLLAGGEVLAHIERLKKRGGESA